MILPEDPNKRLGLWESVAAQLGREPLCFVVSNGIGNIDAAASIPDDTLSILERFKSAQICRISANRGMAISPHFAGNFYDNAFIVRELVTYTDESGMTVGKTKLKSDIETVVINLMYGGPGINIVHVPLHIAPWAMPDAEITLSDDGLIFTRKP